ncbi:MAG TPA: phosphotransferase [Anaerolineae bacterium]|nr:phosphotransferase [Anaerolineae bacterium]HQI85501.1 phosphotransferase [Anaerolineae bacterium]
MTLSIVESLKPDLDRLYPETDRAAWRFVCTTAAGDNRNDAKVTVFVYNTARHPMLVLKTSLTGDDTWVKNQYLTLQFLEHLKLWDILYPRPIALIEHDQHRFYVESYVDARPVAYRGKSLQSIMRWAIEWLTTVHCATSASDASASHNLSSLLTAWVSIIQDASCLTSKEVSAARVIAEAAREVTSAFPTVLMHGDFHPNQFLHMYRAQTVGIVDWEHAILKGWPVLDLIELLSTTAYLAGQYPSSPQACQTLFMQPNPHPMIARFLDNYWSRLVLPPDTVKLLLGVYGLYSLAQVIALRGDILPLPAITERSHLLLAARSLLQL